MSQLAAGKEATAICQKKDRYKRHICIVYVSGDDVSLAQLEAGLAWVYRKYVGELPSDLQAEYLAAEARAGANRVGLR